MSEPLDRETMDGGRIVLYAADRSTLIGRDAPPLALSVTPTPSPYFGATAVGVSLSIADARALRDMLDLLLVANGQPDVSDSEAFDRDWALVAEVRQIDGNALAGGCKITGAAMPLIDEVEGHGAVALDTVIVIFDASRDYVVLATFPRVRGPRVDSEAERAALEARLGYAARNNGLVMTTSQINADGDRDRVYIRILSMAEREFYRSIDHIPPFTAEGLRQIHDFSNSVLRAARARFPEGC